MIAGRPEALLEDPKPIIIRRGSASRPLVVYVLQTPSASTESNLYLAGAKIIVLAVDQQASGPADPAQVRDLLGLTLGEARIASLVGSGLSPRDAARQLGIAEGTVRVSLRRIYAKVSISRQSELAVMLTKLAVR